MSATLRRLPAALAVSILLTVPWAPRIARGADDAGPPRSGTAETATKAGTDAPDGRNEKSLREQDIYIPYDKLRQVFEKHGRGVFLPYEEFEQLWQAAQDKNRPAARPRPPVGAVITEIENEATVAKDVVRVKATVKIDLLAEGWHEIPLRLADAAITSATLGGEAGPHRRRRRRRLQAAGGKEGQAARADRAVAGVCQGDQQDAGPEQRVVPGARRPR